MRVLAVFFSLLMSLAAGCSGQNEISVGTGRSSQAPGPAPGNGAEEITVPPGTFSLHLTTPTSATHTLHLSGSDFQAPCAVDPSATDFSDRDIECMVEVDELDLVMYGLSFTTQISGANCAHVSYTPYYYFSAPAGPGPTAVAYEVNEDSEIIAHDINGFSAGNAPYCPYDYSHAGGPNCCTGNYSLTVTKPDGDGGTETETTQRSWGGSASACISGAGTLDEMKDGMPATVYYANSAEAGGGLAISKSYSGVLGRLSGRGLRARPGYTTGNAINSLTASGRLGPMGFMSLFLANYVEPANWGGGEPEGLAQAYYEFTCYDPAHEETGRIRLVVREWNVAVPYAPGSLARADEVGMDGDYYLNDFGDWEDVSHLLDGPPSDPYHYLPGYPYFHISR